MNLLEDAWIPVRADGGAGAFRLLTYQELLCEPGNWQVSLPRDDLELACVQLLVHDPGHVHAGRRPSFAGEAGHALVAERFRHRRGALPGLV